MIKDFEQGYKVDDSFLVVQSLKGVTNASEAYLNLILQDKTGTIEAKKWNATIKDDDIFQPGNIVHITGDVILYKNKEQIKIASATLIQDYEVDDLYDYLTDAPVSKDELLNKITSYISEITNDDIRKVINEVFKDCLRAFSIYPAASKNHHEYVSGLMHHTATMLDVAKALTGIYPNIDKNYLYAGILLHDVGKIDELSGPAIPKYTTKGKLLGHISIMQAKVYEICKKLNVDEEISTVLQHLILSHHGQKEFGSPVAPSTREAELIHEIDNLDSKMNMIEKALSEIEVEEFTNAVRPLENRVLYKPKPTKKG